MEGEKDLVGALLKKALGYDAEEIVEEYADGEDEMRLVKRKVTRKNVPPDVTAIKMLLDSERSVAEMSDAELEAEKRRLIGLLAAEEKEEIKSNKGEMDEKE